MRLAAKVHYGTAALFDLAFHCSGRAAQAREIAERQAIPARYLEQILQDFRRAGLVEARRGPRGGYVFARAPESVSLADVMSALDEHDDTADEAARAVSTSVTSLALGEIAAKVDGLFAALTIAELVRRAELQGVVRITSQPQMYFI